MKRCARVLLVVIFSTALTACGSNSRHDRALAYQDRAAKNLTENACFDAYVLAGAGVYSEFDDVRAKARAFFRSDAYGLCLERDLTAKAAAGPDLEEMAAMLDATHDMARINDHIARARTTLDGAIAAGTLAGIRSGKTSVTLGELHLLPGQPPEKDITGIAYASTIASLREKKNEDLFTKTLAFLASPAGEPYRERFRTDMRAISYTSAMLSNSDFIALAGKDYAGFAHKVLPGVVIALDPPDEALLAALSAHLQQNGNLRVVPKEDASACTVTLKRREHTISDGQSTVTPVAFRRQSCQPAVARAMPANAVYAYDVVERKTTLAIDYAVTVSKNKKKLQEDTISETSAATSVHCTNIRIQDAYGRRFRPAGIANNQMANQCARTGQPVDTDKLNNHATDIIALRVEKLLEAAREK